MKTLRSWPSIFLFINVCLIDLSYYLAFLLKFPFHIPSKNFSPFLNTLPYISILAFALLWVYDLDKDGDRRPSEILTSVFLVSAMVNVGAMAMAFWFRGFAFPRTVFILAFTFQFSLLTAWNWICWIGKKQLDGSKTVVFVGRDGEAAIIADRLGMAHDTGINFVADEVACIREGWTEKDRNAVMDEALGKADLVYITGSVAMDQREAILIWCARNNKEVGLVPGLYDILLHHASVTNLGDQPILQIEQLTLTGWQRVGKRLMDLVLALLLGTFGLLLSPFIILAIKLTSPGPVFYRQLRMGQGGKYFYIYKFRTMVENAEKKTGPVMALEHDQRITSVGRLLRAVRLDEIPQVINILKGEMSFVGPRPERPVFVEQFAEDIPLYSYRFRVKPGITGLAQVKGNYATNVFDKLRYDLYYIRNYSLWLDLKIIFQTARVILTPGTVWGVNHKDSTWENRTESKKCS